MDTGRKNCPKRLVRYPRIALVVVFSPYTNGPVKRPHLNPRIYGRMGLVPWLLLPKKEPNTAGKLLAACLDPMERA